MARVSILLLGAAILHSLLPTATTAGRVAQDDEGYSVPYFENTGRQVSQPLFEELNELANIVDIAYCVGNWGITKPFSCPGLCEQFPNFELVKTWNTGPLLSDSCGYIALSHPPSAKRIIVSFRGTYSIVNAIADLSVAPQVYVPYPNGKEHPYAKCDNCTAHGGFMRSWENTRPEIIPDLIEAMMKYPDYQLVVTGHSLGGAVAALGSLEFKLRGWNPHVTTFGEPRIGNQALADYFDKVFGLNSTAPSNAGLGYDLHLPYRRVTHTNDPVPLLPPPSLDYRMHSGEIFITKVDVPPAITDLRVCYGPTDPTCISEEEQEYVRKLQDALPWMPSGMPDNDQSPLDPENADSEVDTEMVKPWELFFAHRDYFHRVGICFPNIFGSPDKSDKKSPWWKFKWLFPGHDNL
ncbi:TPA_exp: putative Lipase [Trichophyton benhamiae CBS 112371]|uniref:Lipase, putative n=1 Tax=Arthroderma benhamiae (strain ATCC MYA-4681 / CBS 112371) TaxID=663331 RepID=D4AXS9_ARTBC|nr:lipase, putative [Trichophyton benhamiae CBS 112371]EFE32107.1 lipase, putative [Trichophyton benhamiae CBS 112371]DAA75214.1 TPA_exp: putative Lipase [Trichophyton benhamiae CBS 112371]